MKLFLITFLFTIWTGQIAYADGMMRPDGHAPIGVMGDHGHKAGELMLSYRYGRMEMDGNRSGSTNISTDEILRTGSGSFLISPLEMTMEMHMFGAMYGLGNNLTLMAMVPYVDKSMDLIDVMGRRFTTRASGLGDIKLSGIYKLHHGEFGEGSSHTLNMNLGLSLPTGDRDKRDVIPASMGNPIRLPYPMQLGSGTYDPILGITYTRLNPQWSWGLQFQTTQRLGKNSEGYRLGDEYMASTWAAYKYSNSLSASMRINGKSWNNISGQDNMLNPAAVPTARTDLRGGERAELGIGINFRIPDGMFKGHRLAAEFMLPFYQHLDGPQLEVDYAYTLGWQAMF